MSILTGLVIVVAMAVLAQRSDSLIGFVTREKAPMISPQNDQAIVAAGDSKMIDVLSNDENVDEGDADNLRIVVSPSCGAAEATDTGVLYISNNLCVGPQLFAYCVARGDECPSASVTVVVADDPALVVAAARREAEESARRNAQAAAQSGAQTSAQTQTQTQTTAQAGDAALAPQNADAPAQTESASAPSTVADAETITISDTVAAAIRPVVRNEVDALADEARVGSVGPASVGRARPVAAESAAPISEPRVAALSDVRVVGLQSVGPPEQPTLAGGVVGRSEAPDVSSIRSLSAPEDAPAETEVAALAPQPDEETLLRMQRAAADAVRDNASSGTAPAVVADCGPVELISKAAAGGASVLDVASPCRSGLAYEVLHAGLAFGGRLDNTGNASQTFPVLDESGDAKIVFADGVSVDHELKFNWRELEMTRRIAVAWTDNVDLDLHAFEYAAEFGEDGHVWQQRPRGFRLVRRSGGGYLDSFPAMRDGGQTIEVYTFWANSRARRGVARIALDHASRGAAPSGDYCGEGRLASPGYVVVRSERGIVTSRAKGRFASARCGASLSGEARYASGALRDLEIE